MKTGVKYKNGAFICVGYTDDVDRKKQRIPKIDTIKLKFSSPTVDGTGSYFMTPDELLDLAMVSIEFLANNHLIKRQKC